MKRPKKDKDFIKTPSYPGGKDAFKKFIDKNLQYPKEAYQKGIEGEVIVKYQVNNLGNIVHAEIEKGIGYGCDEEALRLIRMLKYEKVKNRKIRLKATKKAKIKFKIRKKSKKPISFTYENSNSQKSPQDQTNENPSQEKDTGVTYSYTIDLS